MSEVDSVSTRRTLVTKVPLSFRRLTSVRLIAGDRPKRCLLGVLVCVAVLITPPAALALALVRGPYLQQPTPTSMIVRWRTDAPTESTLRYGLDFNNLSLTISIPGPVTEHEIEVQGLKPGAGYYYSVGTPSQTLAGADADHYFVATTLPDTARRTRIWVLGDQGTNSVIRTGEERLSGLRRR